MSRLTPWQARGVLMAVFTLAAACVAITLSPLKSGYADGARFDGPGDVALYQAEIDRIRSGECYYQAAAAELRARGFPTASVFNWRTPLPMSLIGRLPHPLGKFLLCALAVMLILHAMMVLARQGGLGTAALGAALMFGAVMPVFLANLHVMPVLWAGVLIGLSVCAYAHGHWKMGVLAGLLALFFRDLAGPYCVLSLVLALRHRRRGEVLVWLAGLAAYGLFFAWHCWVVRGFIGAGDMAHEQGWVRFGGLPFLLSAVQTNAYLLISPQWLTGLYFVAAMVGLAAWDLPAGVRIAAAVCLYTVTFAVIGQPFNQYWGAMVAPLFCFGAARFPKALRDLWRAARSPRAAELASA